MENWTDEQVEDLENYLATLTEDELKLELQYIEMIGQAKKSGKILVLDDGDYLHWGYYVNTTRRITNFAWNWWNYV